MKSMIGLGAMGLVLCACGDSGGAGGAGGASSTTSSVTDASSSSTKTSSATTGSTATAGSGSTSTGATSDTYANFASGFFTTYCVECHGSTNAADNFTTLAGVTAEAANIRCGTAPVHEPNCGASPAAKQFPIANAGNTNPKPSDADRARIVAWIDAGLPN